MSESVEESVQVRDSGFHLPPHTEEDVATSSSSSSSHSHVVSTPLDSTHLLSSLLSLPPRAQKRRRGTRFVAEAGDAPVDIDSETAAPMTEEGKQLERPPLRERKFEYLDHTADIQLHSWGDNMSEALEQVVIAMFSYITDLAKVDIDPSMNQTFEVKGHDMDSLLFTLLDEFLFRFATNEWIPRDVKIHSFNPNTFTVHVTGYGEHFTLAKHTQGTEIKAITYSNMQIYNAGRRVKSDNDANRKKTKLDSDDSSSSAAAKPMETADADEEEELTEEEIKKRGTHGADIYVIVDI